MATCAGLILLAQNISNDENRCFATLPVTVKRNAYGRQLGSFYYCLLYTSGNMIEASIGNAVKALMKQDEELAKKTMAGDEKIDRTERKIEDLCLRLLLQQQPVARDLRNISSCLLYTSRCV